MDDYSQKQNFIYTQIVFWPLSILFWYQLEYSGSDEKQVKLQAPEWLSRWKRSVMPLLCGQACDDVIMWSDTPIPFAQARFLSDSSTLFCHCIKVNVHVYFFLHVVFSLTKIHYERQLLEQKLIWNSPSRQLQSVSIERKENNLWQE